MCGAKYVVLDIFANENNPMFSSEFCNFNFYQ